MWVVWSCCFVDSQDSQLSRQLVSSSQVCITFLLQVKLTCRFVGICHIAYIVSRCIKGVHGFKQGLALFLSWCKLQEHRLFHRRIVSYMSDNVNGGNSSPDVEDRRQKREEKP